MDSESPDALKNFPGLYGREPQMTKTADADYTDDADKTKKDAKRKDKKDKERGYAALEGESSTEESCDNRSPSKSKKSKSFKFAAKSKERREKSRDKEVTEKKRDKKNDKKGDKRDKKTKCEENVDVGDALAVFGVPLETAVRRGRCHDGIELPLPLRNCIDFVEKYACTFEGVYKINAPKSKVAPIKKLYNRKENVDLTDYDVPTVTALFKTFIRGLGEPLFTSDLAVRFEEAGAILNVATREKHLKILIGNLPRLNRIALSWIIAHLYNVTLNEKYNKMNAQSLGMCLSSTLQTSNRLLTALLCHRPALFPDTAIIPYEPPVMSTSRLPDDPTCMHLELLKQESLLAEIHYEMSAGIVLKQREELLWEVQRIITQLKRKLKSLNKDKEASLNVAASEDCKKEASDGEAAVENISSINISVENPLVTNGGSDVNEMVVSVSPPTVVGSETSLITEASACSSIRACESSASKEEVFNSNKISNKNDESDVIQDAEHPLALERSRNVLLRELRNSLISQIEKEKKEIDNLKSQVDAKYIPDLATSFDHCSSKLDRIMDLLQKENQILEIKKITLVRQIMEQLESCIDLKTKIEAEVY